MTDVGVVLSGLGPVGTAYLDVVRSHAARWRARYGVGVRVVLVRGRSGQTEPGDPLPQRRHWSPLQDLASTLREHRAVVFAQAVPSSAEVAPPALADILTALDSGAHVVTAAKSPLLRHWGDLDTAARAAGRGIGVSGATGAALPAGDLARSGLRGFDVERIEGCPNGTATYVLDRLAEGVTFERAIDGAQALGIAEADPGADLSGQDAATKIRLLAGLAWGRDVTSIPVTAEPITRHAADVAREAAGRGQRLRHVAAVDETGEARVELRAEPAGSALGALVGPDKAMTYHCGAAGAVTVSGGRSSPHGAALALAKDTLAAVLAPTVGLY